MPYRLTLDSLQRGQRGPRDRAIRSADNIVAINHRPTRGSISSYNTTGLISEVSEEVAI